VVAEFGVDQLVRGQRARHEHHRVVWYAGGGPGSGIELRSSLWREPPTGPGRTARPDPGADDDASRRPATARDATGPDGAGYRGRSSPGRHGVGQIVLDRTVRRAFHRVSR